MVEHDLAKVGVAGSSPVFRSRSPLLIKRGFFLVALVVELVDTQDLKSCGQQWPYRFNSDPGHTVEAVSKETAFFFGLLLMYRRIIACCLKPGF